MRPSVTVTGIDQLLRQLERQAGKEAVADIDKITEAYARKMAGESAQMAPVDTSLLKNTIASSPEPALDEHHWQYGTGELPYAIIQEYEHKSNKAFIRRAVWNNREKYRLAVLNRILKGR